MRAQEADNVFDEVAAGFFLGGNDHPISARTMQRWRQIGLGPPFVRIGSQIRYRRIDLETWMRSRIVDAAAAKAG